ncbi:hypothetical protein SAY86_011369 [Trapa natans]|uniref:Cytochrome P450 n=1 Tax=Trapa natans TaxID=22666 RepID=A0AAN7LYW6_TRANT|nr:hypothetical protein SAY86_011369 [Trapa natans]
MGAGMGFLVLLLCLSLSWALLRVLCRGGTRSPKRRRPAPPGPWPLPIVGNLLQLDSRPDKKFAELAKTYGSVMTLQLGRVPTVIISSAQAAREALRTHDLAFSGRTVPDAITVHDHDRFSVGWMPVSSPTWSLLRRIMSLHVSATRRLDSTRALRRRKMEEALATVQKRAVSGLPVEIAEIGFMTTCNFLSNALFSMDLVKPGNEEGGKELGRLLCLLIVEVGKPNLADYFPVLKWMDPNGRKRRSAMYYGQLLDMTDDLINKRLQLREKTSEYLTRETDVLDSLFDIWEDKSEEKMIIGMDHIKHLITDLFVGGTDTISTTLEWAMAELLRHPDKLSRAKAELDRVIGRGHPFEESDIQRLPYLHATIKETLRLHPTVPLLLPRKTEAEAEICGFTVQKGIQVLINVWAIGHDPSLWEDPGAFIPERFLGGPPNSSIDFKGQDFELIPFGAGRRICPGIQLTTRMLHLMLGSLINCFDWKLEDGMKPEEMNMEEVLGITL